jgi:hypothetical protein
LSILFLVAIWEVVVRVGLHLLQIGEVRLPPFILIKVTLVTEDGLPILKPLFIMDKAAALPTDCVPVQDVDLPATVTDFLFDLFEGDLIGVVVWFTGYVKHPENEVNREDPSG